MQIHLIRHGEVDNPRNVVYADITGFNLSTRGRHQALAAGEYLSEAALRWIVSSPLDRALETAHLISSVTGAGVVADERLTEWGLIIRWRGARWPDLPIVYPGELEAYLAQPSDVPFADESLTEVARRIASAVADWTSTAGSGSVAFVSHQDPIHAAYLHLARHNSAQFHIDKPTHASVLSLQQDGEGWIEMSRWQPRQ